MKKATTASITCPHCKLSAVVSHLDWTAIVCRGCRTEITKAEATRKKASGRNISEAERGTERISLRFHPVFAAIIRKVAEHDDPGFTMAEMIEHAFFSYCKNGGAASPNDIKAMSDVLDVRYGHAKGSADE